MKMFKELTASILRKLGYRLEKCDFSRPPLDMEKGFEEVYVKAKAYTLTSVERMYALYKAVQYIVSANVSGDIGRTIYLYDTYEGMTKPGERDVMIANKYPAEKKWAEISQKKDYRDVWFCYASLEEVEKNLRTTKYPEDKLIFVKGNVEETIPKITPKQIAILRLDTDWYASTKHVLAHLFPKLAHGGVLIVDDYGHWQGAKEAVDEYFKEQNRKIFLIRVDKTGYVGIKI